MDIDSMNQMMAAFVVFAGIIALYYAITGKGSGFKNDYPKEIKAEANQLFRTFCWIIGPIILASGVLEFLGHSWAYWVGLAIVGPAIIVYMIIFRKKFGKYLKKKKK